MEVVTLNCSSFSSLIKAGGLHLTPHLGFWTSNPRCWEPVATDLAMALSAAKVAAAPQLSWLTTSFWITKFLAVFLFFHDLRWIPLHHIERIERLFNVLRPLRFHYRLPWNFACWLGLGIVIIFFVSFTFRLFERFIKLCLLDYLRLSRPSL